MGEMDERLEEMWKQEKNDPTPNGDMLYLYAELDRLISDMETDDENILTEKLMAASNPKLMLEILQDLQDLHWDNDPFLAKLIKSLRGRQASEVPPAVYDFYSQDHLESGDPEIDDETEPHEQFLGQLESEYPEADD